MLSRQTLSTDAIAVCKEMGDEVLFSVRGPFGYHPPQSTNPALITLRETPSTTASRSQYIRASNLVDRKGNCDENWSFYITAKKSRCENCCRRDDAMVGFIEVSETAGSKYGMGSDVPLADTRPVVSNLAVDPIARRSGIGTALMDACEDMVNTWDFEEIILQASFHVYRQSFDSWVLIS